MANADSRTRSDSGASAEDFWALKHLSFEAKRGEVLGIIGRNGAGKSTLLKVLSRITEPTSGRIGIKGRVSSLLEVGTGFHPELSGRENIFLNGAILGMSRAEIKNKFDEIVAFAAIEKFLDTPVKRYSSGMYVRLAFAVAAHLESEILIVDEVLAVGDLEFQNKCLGKMQDVASQQGRTVLFVSHNMAAVQNLCSRSFLLVEGGKKFDGPVEEAVKQYATSTALAESLAWSRAPGLPAKPVMFERIQVASSGKQPHLTLRCILVVNAVADSPPMLVAVDVCDKFHIPIMQALPSTQPMLLSPGKNELLVEIELPPLVPAHYVLDFWIGAHFSSTADYVKHVVVFEVSESPSAGRTFPHATQHGYIVPLSRLAIL